MFVCICNSVTDSQIRQAVDAGARDIDALKMVTGCATGCGCCLETAVEALNEALVERKQHLRIIPKREAA